MLTISTRAAALLGFIAFASAANAQFPNPQFSAGSAGNYITGGDLNNDTIVDLLVAGGSGLSVLLGHASGGFSAPVLYANGGTPQFITLGDVNNDGKTDAVTASPASNGAGVFLGDAVGGFYNSFFITTFTNPENVALGDMDGDGDLDMVLPNPNGNGAKVYFGNAFGTFPKSTSYAGFPAARFVALDDADQNGKLDIFIAQNLVPGAVGILFNQGVIHSMLMMTPASGPAVGNLTQSLTLGDINNDGYTDIATANGAPSVSVSFANGAGGFAAASHYTVPSYPRFVVIDDMNGDAAADLVTANVSTSTISLLLGNGAGGFANAINTPAGAFPYSVLVYDYNQDTNPDIVTINNAAGGSFALVLLGDGQGGLLTSTNCAVGSNPHDLAVADLNHDGRPDLAAAFQIALPTPSSGISVLLQNNLGNYNSAATVGSGTRPVSLAAADVNADGFPDLISPLLSPHGVGTFINNGNASFSMLTSAALNISGNNYIHIADVNADGKPDVLLTDGPGNNIIIFIGDGSGGFAAGSTWPTGTFPMNVDAADLNHDGVLDLATAGNNQSGVSVLVASAPGNFAPAVHYLSGNSTNFALFEDFTANGDLDLAVAGASNVSLIMLTGDGLGGFGGASNPTVTSSSYRLDSGDFDADGIPDLAAATFFSNALTIITNPASANASLTMYGGGGAEFSIKIADLNGDGFADAAATDTSTSNITIRYNVRATPAGIGPYGAGSFGCVGFVTLNANAVPKVNSPNYGYIYCNVPRYTLGLGIATDAPDVAGSDPFGIGAILLVEILTANEILPFDIYSNRGGNGFAATSIPNDNNLAGKTYYVQTLWLESSAGGQSCGASPLDIITSNAVAATIQP